jgi:hypothetical protein
LRDYLQAPLQPLMDNLESATYETFEKDASKYICYEARAIDDKHWTVIESTNQIRTSV